MCVQFWGLLTHCLTLAIGNKLRASLREVLDVNIFVMPSDQGIIVKALVEVDVGATINEGRKVGKQRMAFFGLNFGMRN